MGGLADAVTEGQSLDPLSSDAMPLSHEILASIPDEQAVLGDGRFFKACDELLRIIDRERNEQGLPPYSRNHRIIFACELFRVATRYSDYPPRKDGTNVFYSHLVGSLRFLIQDTGLTGISSLVAMMNHDTVEDFTDKSLVDVDRKRVEEKILETLVDPTIYQHLLENFDSVEADDIARKVKQMVIGVTKWRKGKDDGATKEATFKRLLEVITENVRALYLKFADRRHNNATITGHGNDAEGLAKQSAIIDETVDIYLPLARALGIRVMVRRMLLDCLKFQNPKLSKDFQRLIRTRVEARLAPFQNSIFSELVVDPKNLNFGFVSPITTVFLNPRDIDHYTSQVNGSFEDVDIEDLPIGRLDPMFEIVVTVDDSEMAIRQVVTMIIERFGSDVGAKSNISYPDDDDDLAGSGAYVSVFNKRFGGQLHFRVNGKYAEARLKRGILADYQDTMPDSFRDTVRAALDRAVPGGIDASVAPTIEAAQHELLQPEFEVLTKDGDHMTFKRGATVLDFAARVHSDVLLNIDAAYVSEDVLSPKPGLRVDFTDRLIPGKVYTIDELPKGEPKKVNLRWLLFAQSTARSVLREYLRDPDVEDVVYSDVASLSFSRDSMISSNAHAYVRHLASVFGVTYEYLMRAVESTYANKAYRRDGVVRDIGLGRIDPVSAFAGLCDDRFEARNNGGDVDDVDAIEDHLWKVEFLLPSRNGELKRFSSHFTAAAGVDIYKIDEHVRDYREGYDLLRLEIDILKSGISFYDLFKLLIKLNEYYPIRIVENPYKETRMEREMKFAEVFGD